jgi:hypothetical protein
VATTKYGDISPRTAAWVTEQLKQMTERRVVDYTCPPDPSWSEEMKEAHYALHWHTITFRRYPPG